VSVFDDRWLIARAGAALVLANARFWTTTAAKVATQLRRWQRSAETIDDPVLRALALEKLRDERFNAEVAATLATLAPRRYREHAVEAIVAYEVMYDYLDGLTERAMPDPLRDGRELYRAFTDAISLQHEPRGDYYAHHQHDDNGYLERLVSTVRGALAALPAASVVGDTCEAAATRCAEAQVRAHAVPRLGTGQLEAWAISEAAGTGLGWQAFLAGAASSVLSVHALIAAAADPRTTTQQAETIDTVYLSICALSTMLDSLVDHQRDEQAGQAGYIRYYQRHDTLASDLTHAARRATEHAVRVPSGAHHVMTLVGVASYYLSVPTATSDFARPVTDRVRAELQPLITPTLAVMGAWRLAKRGRRALTNNTSVRCSS
jgi:tetraprenyl-beta-curcumene synthase